MMNDTQVEIALDIRPIDTLFFRDARPFEPAGQGRSGLPTPQTLAGAVRTLLLERLGVDWKRFAHLMRRRGSFRNALCEMGSALETVADVCVCGPWLRQGEDVLMPTPVSVRQVKGSEGKELVRLDPIRKPPPGWAPQRPGMLPLWVRRKCALESPKPYIRPAGLAAFLRGDAPDHTQMVGPDKLYEMDTRVGIGLDAKRGTAEEGMIYSACLLSLNRGVSFYASVFGPPSVLAVFGESPTLMRFGGEGRFVEVRRTKALINHSTFKADAADGVILLLTTPAWFGGWKPPDLQVTSAAVGKPVPISGWDMARGGPKPNRFMVPAGTAYFVSHKDYQPMVRHVNKEDSVVGWGQFVEGIWNYV